MKKYIYIFNVFSKYYIIFPYVEINKSNAFSFTKKGKKESSVFIGHKC